MSRKNNNKDKKAHAPAVDLNNRECVWIDNGKKSIAYFCKKMPVKVGRKALSDLKYTFNRFKDKNVRLCLHQDPQARSHDMLIIERKGKYYRPHKHLMKGEAFHIIDGKMAVFVFDDNGKIIDASLLSCKDNFLYKVGEGMYHMVMPISDFVVYHESKPGPFMGSKDSIYPFWAPDGSNLAEIRDYIKRLRKTLR